MYFKICIFSILISSLYASHCADITIDQRTLYDLSEFSDEFYEFSVNIDDNNVAYVFSICTPSALCNGTKAYASQIDIGNNICTGVFQPGQPEFVEYDESNIGNGLVATYGSSSSPIIVNMICNSGVNTVKWEAMFDNTSNSIVVTGAHSQFCAYAFLNEFFSFLSNNKVFFILIYLIVGGVIWFNSLKQSEFLAVALNTSISLFIYSTLLMDLFLDTSQWILFLVAYVGAQITGIFAVKFQGYKFFSLGFCSGLFAALFLFNIFAPALEGLGSWVIYVFGLIIGLIGAFIGMSAREDILVFATSFVGSFLIIRSLTILFGFPTEYGMAVGYENFDFGVYVYLIMISLATYVGQRFHASQHKTPAISKPLENPSSMSQYKSIQL